MGSGGWQGSSGTVIDWIAPVVVLLLVLLLAVIALVVWRGKRDSALEILKRRYARGEIGKEEYEEKKRDLA